LHHGRSELLDDRVRLRWKEHPDADADEKERIRQSVVDETASQLVSETHGRMQDYLNTWRRDRAGKHSPQRSALKPEDQAETLNNIQTALPRNWALLDFWVLGSERVRVFLITQGGLEVIPLNVPAVELLQRGPLMDLMHWFAEAEQTPEHGL